MRKLLYNNRLRRIGGFRVEFGVVRCSYLRRCKTRNAIHAAPASASTPAIPMLVNRKSMPTILDLRE